MNTVEQCWWELIIWLETFRLEMKINVHSCRYGELLVHTYMISYSVCVYFTRCVLSQNKLFSYSYGYIAMLWYIALWYMYFIFKIEDELCFVQHTRGLPINRVNRCTYLQLEGFTTWNAQSRIIMRIYKAIGI